MLSRVGDKRAMRYCALRGDSVDEREEQASARKSKERAVVSEMSRYARWLLTEIINCASR